VKYKTLVVVMRFSSKTFKRGLRRSKRSKRSKRSRKLRKQRGGENGTAYRDYQDTSSSIPGTTMPGGAVLANPLRETDAA